MLKKETVLTGADHPGTKLEVIHTNHGYYLGFRDEDGSAYSRETYYMPKTLAVAVLAQVREFKGKDGGTHSHDCKCFQCF